MAILALLLKLALAPTAVIFLTLTVNTIRGIIAHRTKHRAFRNVRGPARTSLATGNLQELYGPDGLPFYESLSTYGGVAKVHGLFGVRASFSVRRSVILRSMTGRLPIHNRPSCSSPCPRPGRE